MSALRRRGSRLGGRSIEPIVALVAGILILVMPGLLNVIVAVYLIAVGIIGLIDRV